MKEIQSRDESDEKQPQKQTNMEQKVLMLNTPNDTTSPQILEQNRSIESLIQSSMK